jgi:hypothetical protein
LTAQKPVPSKSDSVYKKIEEFSKHKKFFKFMHHIIFKDVEEDAVVIPKIRKTKGTTPIQKSFNKYNCSIIRKINIETLDPFGFSVENEKEKPEKWIEKSGNLLHTKSKNWTIRNLLLFKKNEQLDSLLVNESERLIRSQRYVRSVNIKLVPIENRVDSVDVSVRVLDTWSLVPTGAFSSDKSNLDLTDHNFFGLGHDYELNYIKSFNNITNNTFAYDTRYTIPNFKNTFINTSVSLKNDLFNNTNKTVRMERLFYSTVTRWAGGMYYDFSVYAQSLPDSNGLLASQNFKTKTYQFWGARSFTIFGKQTELGRTTNLIIATGFNNVMYLKKPDIAYDPIQISSSNKTVLATIGISSQKFYQDKYLFRFGNIEDIPYGKVFSLTTGEETKNKITRAYLGGRFSYGTYFDFGYLQGSLEAGTFFNNGTTEQTTFKIEANYFTKLFPIGSWSFRQFIKPVLVIGTNRLNSLKDKLNLVDVNGIPGFNSSPLLGTKKLITTFQTQSYNQKSWYGFNFSPFMNLTLGLLDDGSHTFFNNKVYSQIGLGVLVNNHYLVFNSFQFSLSYYPSMPIDGNSLIKTNAFQNSYIDFHDFKIGQPYVVPYQ